MSHRLDLIRKIEQYGFDREPFWNTTKIGAQQDMLDDGMCEILIMQLETKNEDERNVSNRQQRAPDGEELGANSELDNGSVGIPPQIWLDLVTAWLIAQWVRTPSKATWLNAVHWLLSVLDRYPRSNSTVWPGLRLTCGNLPCGSAEPVESDSQMESGVTETMPRNAKPE